MSEQCEVAGAADKTACMDSPDGGQFLRAVQPERRIDDAY
jgi:hypothetical protein